MSVLEADEAMDIARDVAHEAAALLASAGGQMTSVRHKSNPRDLVTEWDMRSENLIRDRLVARTPGIPLLAEESSTATEAEVTPEYRWVVDPLDGTVNFFHGLPLYSVAISLERRGEPIAGAVHAPALGWQFYGFLGGGSYMNGERIAVSQIATLDRAMLVTGFPYDRATHPENNFAEWEHFQRAAGACRRLGCASLDLCMVACGWLDGYWERRLNAWDMSAGALMVREAGGTVTAPDGGPFVSATGEAVASNGILHTMLLDQLARVQKNSRRPS